jgi:copper chaperone
MNRQTVAVRGMSCGGCERNVENALRTVESVTRVDADHEGDTVEVVAGDGVGDEDIETAVEGAGYDVTT